MTKVIAIDINMSQVIIDLDGKSEAQGLRELADHLDSLEHEFYLHSANILIEPGEFLLTAMVENTDERR